MGSAVPCGRSVGAGFVYALLDVSGVGMLSVNLLGVKDLVKRAQLSFPALNWEC